MQLDLLVQYYRCDPQGRQDEIDTCLKNNLRNDCISAIHLLTEAEYDFSQFPNANKIEQRVIGKRLDYHTALDYANRQGRSGKWILANADIFFDDSLEQLGRVDLDTTVYALSRHDLRPDGSADPIDEQYAHGSQDAWIFQTPIPTEGMVLDIWLGIPGCDNRIAYELLKNGFVVANPCKAIKCYHLDLARASGRQSRNLRYGMLNKPDNVEQGIVAPPPYQFYIYPTDTLGLERVDAYRAMQQTLLEMTAQTDELRSLYGQTALLTKQLEALRTELQSLYPQLGALTRDLTECSERASSLSERALAQDRALAERDRQLAEIGEELERHNRVTRFFAQLLGWRKSRIYRSLHYRLSKKR